jgi:ethanolamine utilization protein EutN
MTLGKIVGNVVSTMKHKVLEGHKLLIVQPVSRDGTPLGRTLVALDVVQAGIGDMVIVIEEGNSGRMILGDSMAPVRSVVVGVVDEVDGADLKGG